VGETPLRPRGWKTWTWACIYRASRRRSADPRSGASFTIILVFYKAKLILDQHSYTETLHE
jgi:hypothetical protein